MLSDKEEDFESCYVEFYKDVFNNIYSFKEPGAQAAVDESLKKLKKLNYSESLLDTILSERMNFSLEEDRYAYLYFYCLLHSKMVNFHFKKFLEENIVVQNKLAKMKNLRICCLSGGVGIDVVAMLKVISDLGLRSSAAKEPLNVEITVVDKSSDWKRESLETLKVMKEHPSLNISREMNIHADFLNRNIYQTFDDTLKENIQKAHFVTMVKCAKDVQLMFPNKSSSRLRKIIAVIYCIVINFSLIFLINFIKLGIFTEFHFFIILIYKKICIISLSKIHRMKT